MSSNSPSSVFRRPLRTPTVSSSSVRGRGGVHTNTVSSSSVRGRGGVHTNTVSSTPRSTRTTTEDVDDQSVVAIVEGRGQSRGEVGMACINLHTSNLVLCQFSDSQMYQRVIAKINVFRPHQILMPATCCEKTGTASQLFMQLRNEVSNVEIVPILRKNFSETKGIQKIKSLVSEKFSTVVQRITQRYYCLAATAALLQYVEVARFIIFSPRSMKVEFQGSENSCMIDSKTAQHLELLHNNQQPMSGHSLLGMLSRCRTPGGSRLLRMNILQPICDFKVLQERLDCIEELMSNREVLCKLQEILSRIPVDVEHIISTLIQIPKHDNARLTEQRINFLIALKHTLELLPGLVNALEDTEHELYQIIREELQLPIYEAILEKIKRTVNEEAQVQKGMINMRRQRYFAVKGGVDPILDIARTAFCEIIEEMNMYVRDLSNEHDMSFRLTENMQRGFYLQLVLHPRGDVPRLPDTFIRVSKYRNRLNFSTKNLLSLDHRCQEAGKEIERITAIIVSDLISDIREDISNLYTVSEAVAKLDVIFALASYSATSRCVRPRFSRLATTITNGRHPVLEAVLTTKVPVPNNTFLCEDVNFALITGPNMSGKTTYLKQVATLQVLAQIGCFVPADAATFRVATNIFSRLGTGDNIEENASSFALEMTEMCYILNNVTDSSLIIIDELGRGTSIEEGTAVSWALAESLLNTKAFVLFATHYLFLTKLEAVYLNVLNYTMETQEWRRILSPSGTPSSEFQISTNAANSGDPEKYLLENYRLKYTYAVKRGVTQLEFYGLKLASSTSYPPHVVNNALSIAHAIIDNRKKPSTQTTSEDDEMRKAKYLLGVHLKLASECFEAVAEEYLGNCLRILKQEFQAKYDPVALSSIESSMDISMASSVESSIDEIRSE